MFVLVLVSYGCFVQMKGEQMKINKAHCLFEQSGTFKNEFIKLGIPAEDYDIQNEFGQTDHVVDLFENIRLGYEGKPSIFDNISQDDLIMAFFPCIRFENQVMLHFRGQCFQLKNYSLEQKMEYCIKLQKEVTSMYELINKMFIICIRKGLRMIVENPYSQEHYLVRYWCLQPSVIDTDRRERGDYFAKPTQFWFLNCEHENNPIFEMQNYNAIEKLDAWRQMTANDIEEKIGKGIRKKTARSMIHPDYANRFIREFIL